MQDAMLKNDIIAALEWEPDIDLGTAGVSVIEGLVTLFGRVGTMPQRDAVERAVLRVRGVATVTNEIEVAASRSERLPHLAKTETWVGPSQRPGQWRHHARGFITRRRGTRRSWL